jgi:cadmium resistance protein CadD (predicted permease)
MSDQKIKAYTPLFSKGNFTWMLIGGVIIALGMFLMSGGKSNDPKIFDTKEVYSTTRITIAPILIILGLVIEIFAIFKKPKLS